MRLYADHVFCNAEDRQQMWASAAHGNSA